MGKLLRVVVIILLALSIAALALGIMLFAKREILKGRTQQLETAITQLGPVVEAGPATEVPPKNFPSKDTSPCAAEIIESPQKSPFWDTYKIELETADLPKLDISGKAGELRSYYKMDPVSGKPEEPKVTTGPGTMQGVLDELQKKAMEQYARLNESRSQLKSLREEYVATVEELNLQKKTLREKMVNIVNLDGRVKDLETEVSRQKAKIQELEGEIKRLQDTIAEKDKEIAKLNRAVSDKENEVSRLKKEIDKLSGARGTKEPTFMGHIDPGEKGKVVAIDPTWNFVVMQVSEDFMKEVLGQDLTGTVPPGVDLMVRRAGPSGRFVTKVRLMNIRKAEGLGVADVLTQWKQGEVNAGDVVFY